MSKKSRLCNAFNQTKISETTLPLFMSQSFYSKLAYEMQRVRNRSAQYATGRNVRTLNTALASHARQNSCRWRAIYGAALRQLLLHNLSCLLTFEDTSRSNTDRAIKPGIQKLALALHHQLQTLVSSINCFVICLQFTSAAKVRQLGAKMPWLQNK